MATTDVERLVVSLEASITKYERAMQKAVGVTNSTMQRVERRQMTAIQRVNAGWAGMSRGLVAAFATVAALRGAQQLVDASTRIQNSLKVAGLEGEQLSEVYDSLFASAQRNAAPVEALVDLYSRASLVQKELGVTTEELLGFTDKIAVALRVSGKSAAESSGALLQLSQALGSGIVRAEEFNSLLEGALPVAQAAAAGLEEAGGSVAKLRQLVVDGKVSSEAFFRAFEAGAVILEQKVANAELTVSQQFVRLQNVLIDVAGKFDDATGASRGLGEGLENLANFIEQVGDFIDKNKAEIGWFVEQLQKVSDFGIPGMLRSLPGLADAIGQSFDGSADSIQQFLAGAMGLDSVAQMTAEQRTAVTELKKELLAGEHDADSLRTALTELGTMPFNLSIQIDELLKMAAAAREATAAASAAAAVKPAADGIALQREEQALLRSQSTAGVTPVSLDDYKPPASSGGGGSGKSPGDRFKEALAAQQQRIDALNRETELQRQLGIAVNDYGFAMERLRAQIELENAAKEAGLPLDERRQQQIDELASGYGRATAEAARLAEAQDQAKQAADELANAGRQALDTIVDGLLEGRDAGEILNSVVKDLTRNLIQMGINAVTSGLFGGGVGGGPVRLGYNLPGYASGTGNTGGARGQVRGLVHGQEAVIPLPNGGRVPVDIRLPALPSPAATQPAKLELHVVSDDEKFGAYVTDISGRVVAATAPGIAEQGAAKAGGKLASGDFDGGMRRRFALAPQAKRR